MRMIVLGAGLALMGASAGAQMGPGAGYPPPGPGNPPLPPAPRAPQPPGQPSGVGGHWHGGIDAPGGVGAYRPPYRGYRVPGYWVSPRFTVTDWNRYGLPQPLGGYHWARYYDDAVMIDHGGQVYDYRSGLDWDGVYDGPRRSSGVGGAVAGAVVGGVAGNLVAGRGDRLAGTLIGAGVGGAAGYAIDRSRGRRGPPPGYAHDDRGPDYRENGRVYRDGYDGPGSWVSPDGRTTVTTTTSGGYAPYGYSPYGYASGGYTTVTVQSAPVVTTTTTEVIEDSVSYSRPVVRRVYRRHVVRARPRVVHRRPVCACGS